MAVDPTGPDAGRLEPGDRLLPLNGDPRAAVLGALYFFNAPIEGVYRARPAAPRRMPRCG